MLFGLVGPYYKYAGLQTHASLRRSATAMILIALLPICRNLMLRDGMLSPNSKILPYDSRASSPLGRHLSVSSASKSNTSTSRH
jgi:hypothetical protein